MTYATLQRGRVLALTAGTVLAASGIAGAARAQAVVPGSVADGARGYGNMCGRCHNARSPLERSDRQWAVILNHMRVRANLTGRQARQVLAFLQATNSDPRERIALSEVGRRPTTAVPGGGDRPASTDPELIARGSQLVLEKACIGCHVVAGAGGAVGPGLDGVIRRRGAAYVRQKLADPTFDNATSMMPNLGLSEDDIEAIVAYLNTLKQQSEEQ